MKRVQFLRAVKRPFTRSTAQLIRQAGIIVLFAVAALLGLVSGVIFAYTRDLPAISALDDYMPNTITRVYAAGGEVVGEFATERRVLIEYDDISPLLRNAIIAAEDKGFNEHVGFSIPSIVRTILADVVRSLRGENLVGASTLTMQLARNIEVNGQRLGLEKRWERKIREAILTIQIEKRYTKREILTLYCNQMYLGSGAYGVEAASRLYFGKSASDLNLEEATLIAGIFQTPSRQSPLVNPERAMARRNYVLQRMAEEGYIPQELADATKQRPIELRGQGRQDRSIAPYFVEEVRQHLENRYGARELYESGMTVRTTLDARLQAVAKRAVEQGLRQVDKRSGFRKPTRNVIADGQTVDQFRHDRWRFPIQVDDVVPAVVMGVSGSEAQVRIGRYGAELRRDGFAWTGRSSAAQLVQPGDLIEVRITALDDARATATVALEQEPVVEGALIAIENRTGRILSMVGGYSFERSKFNRATQALRQIGSLFKVFLYTAAIDRGYTATSLILDEPASFEVGPNQPFYEPTNYDGTYEGPVTLRHALEKSRNLPAVRMLDQIGPQAAVDYARRLGITSPIPPFLSIALGAAEASLIEMTSAYSAFPNRGIRMVPYLIEKIVDREGHVLEQNLPEARDAIRADTAYVMVSMMRGVVQRGTGLRANALNWPLGGKTGTVDDYTDGWFIGFDPDITLGVWVGYDQKKSLGYKQEGSVVALPIWIEYMKAVIADRDVLEGFAPPSNIVFVSVDLKTGKVTEPWAPGAIQETFIAGTQPGGLLQ